MNPTPYTDINELLSQLLSGMQKILGNKLIGLYLYGSLVWGDFDYEISDIDLLAPVATDIDDNEYSALKQMHDDFALQHPKWNDRIEVQYLSVFALKTFKSQSSSMVNISPGEPIHFNTAGKEWLMNWYFVQDYGVTLLGPAPQTLIEPITKDEFLHAVRDHAEQWREHVIHTRNSPPYQAYAILTLCRVLYTSRNGEQVSKKHAALWVAEQLPEWSTLIQNALLWRKDPQNNKASFPETVKFVHFMIGQIVGKA